MSKEIDAVRHALHVARSAYHDSELWYSESVDRANGPTFEDGIEAALEAADKRIADLEAALARKAP